MTRSYSISQLAELVEGDARGETNTLISGVADLRDAGSSDAAWVSNPSYANKVSGSGAGVLLVPTGFGPTPIPTIVCERIDRSVAKLLGAFAPAVPTPNAGVHPTASIDSSATLGDDVAIGPHVVIESGARIGRGCAIHAGVFVGQGAVIGEACVLWPNAVVRDGCVLKNRVILHPNSVIGADGFGYYFHEGKHEKIPHGGGVVLEDDVEVGACSCVDRAKFGYTRIGKGTKIDNLVQIAHNVQIGEHCVFAGQSALAGSVRTGSYCVFGGRVGVIEGIEIGDGARFAACTLVTKNVPAGVTVSGIPACEHQDDMRSQAWIRRLPKVGDQVKDLLGRVEQLEHAAHDKS